MKTEAGKGFRIFSLIWFGQVVSLTGSGLTGFGLGVWVYLQTGSVTQFALISLFTALPGIIFSPIAGALVDRWDRRWAMILSDTGAGICTLSIVLLMWAGWLQIWHIYVAMFISSMFSAFQWPAYSAATTLLVPKQHLGRASGMVQLAEAVSQIGSPVLAGALMGGIGVQGIILIDFVTFLFAVSTLLVVRFPRPEKTSEGSAGKGSLLREAAYGWRYITVRPGLMGLLLFFAATNFATSIISVLFTPLVLNFFTPLMLGTILSVGGLGYLAGSVLMSTWGGPKRRVYGIFMATLLEGLVLFLIGFPPNVLLYCFAAFTFFIASPMIATGSQVIWQTKTAPDIQGRVFAARRMIAWSSLPLAYLLAGPLADKVFEPWMAEGGLLANSVGAVLGVGPGRGIALIFILLGIMLLLVTAVGALYRRLRLVELELPDAIKEP